MVDPATLPFLAELEAKSGKPIHFFRVMANRPKALEGFVPFYGAVMGAGSVERRVKELVYLAVSLTNRCAYCTAAHVAGAKRAGITEEEIQAVEGGRDEGFTAAEQAALGYARELTRTADAAAARAGLGAHFNDEQVVELTLVAAMANFTNRFNNGLGLQPES